MQDTPIQVKRSKTFNEVTLKISTKQIKTKEAVQQHEGERLMGFDGRSHLNHSPPVESLASPK